MRIVRPATLAALLLASASVSATPPSTAQIGETYEITLTKDSSSEGSDGSTESTHDQDVLIERIERVRPDGFEVLFDLPQSATADDRRRSWQFPARVFEPFNGSPKLLNAPQLEDRVDAWLKEANINRQACGHWIFTWNAFRIECDPQSVLETVALFDPKLPPLRQGELYEEAHALRPAPLILKSSSSTDSTFTASLEAAPNAIHREAAEADVVIGEITRKPVSLEAALAGRAKETVSGTIEVTIDADTAGSMRRLTKVTKLRTRRADGTVEMRTATETLGRRLIESK